ncbi:hypothetical protein V1508DRAFT_394229 [Lipomyces doorenjongii]|uniref:uncharacterized protein n=1 Tax=Lipomyces doorenjongii TaxID=383834 RepID=UPI0034CD81F5
MPPFERMTARYKRLEYRALKYGSDDEAAPEAESRDQGCEALYYHCQPAIDAFINSPDDEILPSESASQLLMELRTSSTIAEVQYIQAILSQVRQRPALVTE